MGVFTLKEIEYLQSQKLGRLATVNLEGKPQVAPVGYHYNLELDVIDIGGHALQKTQKFRNIQKNPNVAFVVDDVLPPWRPRGVEIRGVAQALDTGGKAIFGQGWDESIIRITPAQVIGWGLEGEASPAFNRKVARK